MSDAPSNIHLLDNGRPDERDKVVAEFKRNFDKTLAVYAALAQDRFAMYESYVHAGFSKDQAMELVISEVVANASI